MGLSTADARLAVGRPGRAAAIALSLALAGCADSTTPGSAAAPDAGDAGPAPSPAGAGGGSDGGPAQADGGADGGGVAESTPAFASFNVVPSEECVFSVEPGGASKFLPIGLYDLSPGPSPNDNCAGPYVVNLSVTNLLPSSADPSRPEPNILQLHSAEVMLMDLQRRPIAFDGGDVELVNPFLVTTNLTLPPAKGSQPGVGVAAMEAIPMRYAAELRDSDLVGGQILAQIQIFGTTVSDEDIEFRPFVYPIELCDGCLTLCAEADIAAKMLDEEDFTAGECRDNSGQDGRICIDPDC